MSEFIWNDCKVCTNAKVGFEMRFEKESCKVLLGEHEDGWHFSTESPNRGYYPNLYKKGTDYETALQSGMEELRANIESQLQWCETNARIRSERDPEGKEYESKQLKAYRYFMNELNQPRLF